MMSPQEAGPPSAHPDPGGMLACIRDLPRQCRQAWQRAREFSLPDTHADVDRVLVLGMGGSAIGADLVSSLVASEARLPIIVRRAYDIPAFVNERTLVIASSYSGNTEETLSAFDEALQTPARKLAITTGGRLKTVAQENDIPVFTYSYSAQPRAALGFGFAPLLCFMQKLGFIRDKTADMSEAIATMEQLRYGIDDAMPAPQNPAKQLAGKLRGRLPVVYGAGKLSEVAHRWKTQFNENGKAWAFYEVFSELNHNAVVGYRFPSELAERVLVILLRSDSLPAPIQRRYQVTCQLLERFGVGYETIDAPGASALSQMLSLVLLGDYVSYYLATEYRVDPTPVETIDYLKEQLSRPA